MSTLSIDLVWELDRDQQKWWVKYIVAKVKWGYTEFQFKIG